MPLRILHISTRLILGGSQENTVLSCEGQARLGHRVHLAYGPIFGPEGSLLDRVKAFNARCARGEETLPDGSRVCQIVLHEVPSLVREVSPIKDWLGFRQLKALIGMIRPDVVHTHSSKAGILGRAAAWAMLKSHENPGAFSPPFMPIEGNGWTQFKTRCKNALYTRAEQFAAKRCHRIVSVADAMSKQFLDRDIGNPDLYTTVNSGMEVGTFATACAETTDRAKAAIGLSSERFVIGTVARLAEHKGHDDILNAMDERFASRPEWALLWVGDGWWRTRLTQAAAAKGWEIANLDRGERAGPSTRLVLTGLVPPEEVPGLMRAMDVLVHPSYREGLPRTVPQALLSQVCPVAYDVDGTGEVCREMETGRLVPLADIARLGDAILWCADQPLARAALAARGQAECKVRFSAEAMVESLEKVYAAALRL
ncbi:MAG: glycosyltransferase [Planctomycetota bacterium]|nr:glycosyltransferase [Planctomycetota bacterium]